MAGTGVDWNAVVVGAWNPAILTPKGIAQRLFRTEAAVEVYVPVDGQGPIQVRHEGVAVFPARGQLLVTPAVPSREGLVRATEIAARAIEELPETPLTAAGVNVRYGFDPIPDSLVELLASALDGQLADSGLKTQSSSLRRSSRWREGYLNLELQHTEANRGVVLCNFHMDSTDESMLAEWLKQPEAMLDCATSLIRNTLDLMLEESGDGNE